MRLARSRVVTPVSTVCATLKTNFVSVLFWLQQIKAIADAGAKVVVTGGKVGDLALHYCNKYGLLVVRLTSKWDLRRLCRAIRATPLPRIVSKHTIWTEH